MCYTINYSYCQCLAHFQTLLTQIKSKQCNIKVCISSIIPRATNDNPHACNKQGDIGHVSDMNKEELVSLT